MLTKGPCQSHNRSEVCHHKDDQDASILTGMNKFMIILSKEQPRFLSHSTEKLPWLGFHFNSAIIRDFKRLK